MGFLPARRYFVAPLLGASLVLGQPCCSNPERQGTEMAAEIQGIRLRDYEMVVPGEVFGAFLEANYGSEGISLNENVRALYLNITAVGKPGHEDAFLSDLLESGYSEEEARDYWDFFSTPGNIVISDRISSWYIDDAVYHERAHREVDALPESDEQLIIDAWRELSSRKAPDGSDNFFQALREYEGIADSRARFTYKEFIPYLVNNAFEGHVLEVLEQEHPGAFKVFQEIRLRCLSDELY